MIIRSQDDSWLFITQPDHASLAGRLMRHWHAGGLPDSPRRDDILRAVAEHDNGWLEVDAAPLVDPESGELLDFIRLPLAMRQGVWPRGVRRLESAPYAAALVANHAVHVFARFRGQTDWTAFFDEMTALRTHMLDASGVSLDSLLSDYAFVRLGDLLSLTFCNAWTEAQDEFGCALRLVDGTRLVVTPDPFDGREIPFAIAARILPASAVPTEAAARAAWPAAKRIVLTGIATGG
jgi:hypothetical protein